LQNRYDFEHLDKLSEDQLAVFVLATYGEGEPTDNAVAMLDFLKDDSSEFSKGGSDLSNLHYVVFGLGNRTYEHFCAMGTHVDELLAKRGAKRIAERGEGDDDKSMEEDYLAWKDPMFEALQRELKFDADAGNDTADFEVRELSTFDLAKVYLGELSQRALAGTRGVYDAKNPCMAPLVKTEELFLGGERNCIFAEFDITDTGIRYQAGDHIGVWPLNADIDVSRILKALGLDTKADAVVDIISLDPALAKVPFPTPTTYDAIFRHYLDICHVASRQSLGLFAPYAPSEKAKELLTRLGNDRDYYHDTVAKKCLKLAEVLIWANGEDYRADPATTSYTAWNIPFDRIVSGIPRLQPRYYSISSSPKIAPNSIHVTAVVLKYQPEQNDNHVYGVGTNYLLNLKLNMHGELERLEAQSVAQGREVGAPTYKLEGPRGKLRSESGGFKVPVHVRRSNFRLPTSPKIPVIMIGPGTGVAPFRGFVQERVALARRAIEKDGPDALKDWGTMTLYFGCRKREDDYLYEKEWEQYAEELKGKFVIRTAFSRQPGEPKTYVQKLIADDREQIADAILTKKGYVYICGDARSMVRLLTK
jgi:NADPH-ferrihemoprotein reductase